MRRCRARRHRAGVGRRGHHRPDQAERRRRQPGAGRGAQGRLPGRGAGLHRHAPVRLGAAGHPQRRAGHPRRRGRDRRRRRHREHEPGAVLPARRPLRLQRRATPCVVDSNTESQPRSQPYEVYGDLTMGLTAENLAEKYEIIARGAGRVRAPEPGRAAFDAIESGRFKDEIVPVEVPQRKGPPAVFDTDEHPRKTSLEQLAKLRPVFKEGGSVTAGNSSGRNDGGACLVLMSAAAAKQEGHHADGHRPRPGGRRRRPPGSWGSARRRPRARRSSAPASACRRHRPHRGQRGLRGPGPGRASRSSSWTRRSSTSTAAPSRSGHPLGCSGARILTTLLFEMRKRGTRYGLAGICIAGGQGMATVVEMAQ